MDSLVRVVAAVADAVRDDTPSGPVEIGTGVRHRHHAEIGSWQTLILMFVAAIGIGTAVLMYVVRQRRKLLERRRLRRLAEAAHYAEPQRPAAARPDATATATAAAGSRAEPAGPERVT